MWFATSLIQLLVPVKLAFGIVLQRNRMKKEVKIALFVSGKGSNARAVIDFSLKSKAYTVAAIYASSPKSQALLLAKEHNLHSECISDDDLSGNVLFHELNDQGISLIVLAGFLRKIPPSFLKGFDGKMINIHPSLLPAFGGAGMYGIRVHEAVIAANENKSGCTIHFVDEGYDTGAIIAQFSCDVKPDDTPASLAARVLRLEHESLPKTIEQIVTS
jgi:phosphoribosylglycinamide formyltransferase-1